jgi:hypothetical protein
MIDAVMAPGRGSTSRLVSALWVSTAVIGAAGAVLTMVAWHDLKPADSYTTVVTPIAGVVYATLGALVVRRARNRIGWILLGGGLALALMCLTSVYALIGVLTHPGLLPGAKVVGTLSEWTFVPILLGLAYVLLIFPTGTVPSPRWRPVSAAAIAISALALVSFLISPRLVALPAPGGVSLKYPNPLGVRSIGHGISTLLVGTVPSLAVWGVLLLAAAFVALVVRY